MATLLLLIKFEFCSFNSFLQIIINCYLIWFETIVWNRFNPMFDLFNGKEIKLFITLWIIIIFNKFIANSYISWKVHDTMLFQMFMQFWRSCKWCITICAGICFLSFLFVVNLLMLSHIIAASKPFSANSYNWIK